jgi:hypothetical protein
MTNPRVRYVQPARTAVRHDHKATAVRLLTVLGVTAAVVAMVGLIVLGVRAHNARVRDCKAHGGRVTSTTVAMPAYNPNTKTVEYQYDTTYYCATTDRGIIDVWG